MLCYECSESGARLDLVPATDVHDRLDEIEIPGVTESAVPKKAPGSERLLVAPQKKMRR
jgi:hypothetical protein